jgi:hypothetical protein
VLAVTLFVHVPSQNRSKFDSRAVKCIFVGYSKTTKAWLCWDPIHEVTYTSRDVEFHEEKFTALRCSSSDWSDETAEIEPTQLQPMLDISAAASIRAIRPAAAGAAPSRVDHHPACMLTANRQSYRSRHQSQSSRKSRSRNRRHQQHRSHLRQPCCAQVVCHIVLVVLESR